jgi:medium-chain acyl-[acyl-carrier-protein] hydrolase
MPPEVDLCPVELPGRAARLEEPPLTSMSALMETLHLALRPLMVVPFGFFGHSVGAWIAFEAARQLRSPDGRSAVHLFVSGRASPNCDSADPPSARLHSERDYRTILERFDGTPKAVMRCPELMAALLPALKADLALAEGYSVDPGDRIACPISVFGGADDVSHSNSLQSWRDVAGGAFRICMFPGGHFYFSPSAEALANEIIQDLHRFAGIHTASGRSRT